VVVNAQNCSLWRKHGYSRSNWARVFVSGVLPCWKQPWLRSEEAGKSDSTTPLSYFQITNGHSIDGYQASHTDTL